MKIATTNQDITIDHDGVVLVHRHLLDFPYGEEDNSKDTFNGVAPWAGNIKLTSFFGFRLKAERWSVKHETFFPPTKKKPVVIPKGTVLFTWNANDAERKKAGVQINPPWAL